MAGVFISYRREDSIAYAGRLFDRLRDHFGKEQVFMDIDTLQPGEDFVEVLENTLASCNVLVAVIGKKWLTIKDKNGQRRLEDPEDYVRLEITAALERGIRVIPVLVGGAQMPPSSSLPDAMRKLARHQAITLPDMAFHQSVSSLVETMDAAMKTAHWYKKVAAVALGSPLVRILFLVACVIPLALWIWKFVHPSAGFNWSSPIRVTTNGRVMQAAISPDSKYVAYVAETVSGQQALHLHQIEADKDSPLPLVQAAPLDYEGISFSPDSSFIYYAAYEGSLGILRRISLVGGAPQTIIKDIDSPASVSPNGKQIAFIRNVASTDPQKSLSKPNAGGCRWQL